MLMSDIVLQFPTDDIEFRTALEKQFGDQAIIAEVKGFDGVAYCQAIVKVVLPLAPYVVGFLIGYLRESKQRIVLTAKGEIRMENYSVDEAKDLLIQIADKNTKG
jgi:hypothetical protein